jgi:large subunit ribosomal protein L24
MQQPITVDGDIELGAVDLPAAIALAIGIPAQGAGAATGASASASGPWPAEPFEQGLTALSGQIAVKSARVALTPKLAARDVRSVLRFGESELALEGIDGSIAGGRVAADLTFLRRADGLTARGRMRLTGANAAELLPGEGALSGRLTLDVTAEGTGMSPVALVGSLAGSGSFTLENARAARLDPAAFDTVIRAVDQGLPIDAIKVRDRMDAALASGGLALTLAEGAIIIDAGQARLNNTVVRAQRGDLAVSGSVNLTEAALDARLTMFGAGGAGAPANTRPEIGIALKGPIDTPKRTIDVAALASWLALRAVEQQSKKLDVLEGRAPVPPSTPAAVNAPTSAAKPKPAAPAAERVQPLPPPIDIRPAPTPRAPRSQPGAAATQGAPTQAQQKPAPAPPRPRSLSEILFGPH